MAEPTEPKSLWKKVKERQGQFEKVRQPFEGVWKDVIELILPELSLWGDKPGAKRNIQVYNASPEEALENWADGMQGHLVSPSLVWFKYVMSDQALNDIPMVRQWLQECETIIYSILQDSNFYSSLGPIFRGAGSIGNACLFIDEARKGDGIDCSTFHPREVYIAENSRGKVNVFLRKFEMTAINAADEFGKEKLSNPLNQNLANSPFERHKFIHMVCEKDDPIFDKEAGIPDRLWISVYIEVNADPEKEEPLRIAGYWSRPFTYWRLTKASDSVYGWGLGCSALVDIFGLNSVTRTLLEAAHRAVEPPVMVHKSLRGRVDLKPAGQTYFERPEEGVTPIYEPRNFPAGLATEERMQIALEERFNVPFFLMLNRTDKQMTIPELTERLSERGVLLGPKIGRLQGDFLNPTHDRVFEIALSNGRLPPPPNIVLDQGEGRVDVQYIGPLFQIQKRLFETRRTERVMVAFGPMAAVYPAVLDNWDIDKTARRTMQEEHLPEDEIRTEEQVSEMRRVRQEAEKAQQEAELLERTAGLVPNLNKAPEAGSPMEQMAGAGA